MLLDRDDLSSLDRMQWSLAIAAPLPAAFPALRLDEPTNDDDKAHQEDHQKYEAPHVFLASSILPLASIYELAVLPRVHLAAIDVPTSTLTVGWIVPPLTSMPVIEVAAASAVPPRRAEAIIVVVAAPIHARATEALSTVLGCTVARTGDRQQHKPEGERGTWTHPGRRGRRT